MDKAPLKIIENKLTPNILTDLFFALYEDEAFKEAFWERYNFILQSKEIAHDKFKPIVAANAAKIESVLPMQIDLYQSPGSMMQWKIELDKMVQLFEERESVVRGYVE